MAEHRIEFEMFPSDLVDLNRYYLRSWRVWLPRLFLIASFLALGAGGFVIRWIVEGDLQPGPVPYGNFTRDILWALASLLFIGICFWWWRTIPKRHVKKMVAQGHTRNMLGRQVVSATATQLYHSGQFGTRILKWQSIWKTEETDLHILIYDSAETAIIIPKRAFNRSEAASEFVHQVESFRKAAPPYENACPKCGYDLSVATVAGCPECGWRRDAAGAADQPI